jgi:very-short-patch-repair endonuclease
MSVPLRNLFAYIKDLYNTAEPVTQFETEQGQQKTKDQHYFLVDEWIDLHEIAQREGNTDISFQYLNPEDALLKLHRVNIPPLNAPTELLGWTNVLVPFGNLLPILNKVPQRDISEAFDASPQRTELYNKWAELTKQTSADKIDELNAKLPKTLHKWVTIAPTTEGLTLQKHNTLAQNVLFDDDNKRTKAYQQYETEFKQYHLQWWTNIRVNKLYETLHTLYYELKGRDNKRIFLSFGLITGRLGDTVYRNFLYHVPLKLSVRGQELQIDFDTFVNRLFAEQHFTELLPNYFKTEPTEAVEQRKKAVLANIDAFNAQTLQFYGSPDYLKELFYEPAQQILSVFSQLQNRFFDTQTKDLQTDTTFYPTHDAKLITFSFSPVVQTKTVESQIQISKDAANIVQKINDLERNGELNLVPDFFTKLFDLNVAQTNATMGSTRLFSPDEVQRLGNIDVEEEHHLAQKFLFPLPYNNEQLEIANRLLLQDAVTVKGPPGTGKSHTIANLICHFVAQGASILVVSHNAKALSVIKDKLPTEIQQLTVSLVNETKSNDSLKASVNSIITHLAKKYTQNEVQQLQNSLENLHLQYNNTLNHIYNAISYNQTPCQLYNPLTQQLQNLPALEWARFFFAQNHQSQLLHDPIAYQYDTKPLLDLYQQWLGLTTGFTAADFELPNYHFLPDTAFIQPNEVQQVEQRLSHIAQNINVQDYAASNQLAVSPNLVQTINKFTQQLQIISQTVVSWQLLHHPQFDARLLYHLLAKNAELRASLVRYQNQLLEYDLNVQALGATDPDILHRSLTELLEKFGYNDQLSLWQRTFLNKDLSRFLLCQVNGLPADNPKLLKVIELKIKQLQAAKQLRITFTNYLSSLNMVLSDDILVLFPRLDAINIFIQLFEQLNAYLLQLKQAPLLLNEAHIEARLPWLQGLTLFAEQQTLQQQATDRKNALLTAEQLLQPPHPLLYAVADALQNSQSVKYAELLNHYKAQRAKAMVANEAQKLYNQLTGTLTQTMPLLKQAICEQNGVLTAPQTLSSDLFFAQIADFLQKTVNTINQSEPLLEQLQTLRGNIEQKTAELVSYQTWYYKTQQVTEHQKSALSAWLASLVAIGKGYGKNTVQHLNAAVQNMQIAKQSVPVWIMQQQTAITFFPDASPQQFDLLIIDEASQCDISTLNLIFRSRKCIVVGDENQTSVAINTQLFQIDKVNRLLDTYLSQHTFKTSFNVNNNNSSIYTLSGIIYPNIITLTEHFRCQPEIIGYANQYIYNQLIVPLKTATEKLYGSPIAVEYIDGDLADEAKNNIVQRVLAIVLDYIAQYEAETLPQLPTIGILTLDSSNTKHQQLLLRELLRNEKVKQHEESLELLIGTAREFQGDERDVMLLTITTTHTYNANNELRPPRALLAEEFMRIYNVAASRAKERSVLLHSILPEAIGLINPDCYRARLLNYYYLMQSYKPQTGKKELADLLKQTDSRLGEFGRAICTYLFEQGYGNYLTPQMRVANYHIDFALIINNKKLALACDGTEQDNTPHLIEQDVHQQLILERAGWHFVRLQSTNWFFDNNRAKKELLDWVKQF